MPVGFYFLGHTHRIRVECTSRFAIADHPADSARHKYRSQEDVRARIGKGELID